MQSIDAHLLNINWSHENKMATDLYELLSGHHVTSIFCELFHTHNTAPHQKPLYDKILLSQENL
jgi:hypothetical protein